MNIPIVPISGRYGVAAVIEVVVEQILNAHAHRIREHDFHHLLRRAGMIHGNARLEPQKEKHGDHEQPAAPSRRSSESDIRDSYGVMCSGGEQRRRGLAQQRVDDFVQPRTCSSPILPLQEFCVRNFASLEQLRDYIPMSSRDNSHAAGTPPAGRKRAIGEPSKNNIGHHEQQ